MIDYQVVGFDASVIVDRDTISDFASFLQDNNAHFVVLNSCRFHLMSEQDKKYFYVCLNGQGRTMNTSGEHAIITKVSKYCEKITITSVATLFPKSHMIYTVFRVELPVFHLCSDYVKVYDSRRPDKLVIPHEGEDWSFLRSCRI